MLIRIIMICLTLACYTYSFADVQSEQTKSEYGHYWKQTTYLGGFASTNRFDEEDTVYSGGVIGYYHNELRHVHPDILTGYRSDWGIIGSIGYLFSPIDALQATFQFSRGWWLDKSVLFQVSLGPSWSDVHDWGASAMILLGYTNTLVNNSINSGAAFIQADIYDTTSQISLGITIGIGTIDEVRN
ncbi:MAG: hypothetical protein OXI67_16835 [Candidatus Poribacteria bacterium]|nr:hypothetical protein [Candidatus Poribacteria bacterium]